MNPIIRRYHHWVEWSDEDECFLGRCPDLFGGGCHGDDPVQVYQQLLELMDEVAADYQKKGRDLPSPTFLRFSRVNQRPDAIAPPKD